MESFVKVSRIEAPARRLFAWHASEQAFESLIPPWERIDIVARPATLGAGDRAEFLVHIGPFRVRWVAEHSGLVDNGETGGEFTDVQVHGPFEHWSHRHIVRADGASASMLEDRIEYELPFGWIAHLVAGRAVRHRLERLFRYRHETTASAMRAAMADPGAMHKPPAS